MDTTFWGGGAGEKPSRTFTKHLANIRRVVALTPGCPTFRGDQGSLGARGGAVPFKRPPRGWKKGGVHNARERSSSKRRGFIPFGTQRSKETTLVVWGGVGVLGWGLLGGVWVGGGGGCWVWGCGGGWLGVWGGCGFGVVFFFVGFSGGWWWWWCVCFVGGCVVLAKKKKLELQEATGDLLRATAEHTSRAGTIGWGPKPCTVCKLQLRTGEIVGKKRRARGIAQGIMGEEKMGSRQRSKRYSYGGGIL